MRSDRGKNLILILLVTFFTSGLLFADEEISKEYQIKAAFIRNFVKFVEWPEEKVKDSNGPIIIGVLGDSPIHKSLIKFESKRNKGSDIEIRHFESLSSFEISKADENEDLRKKLGELDECYVLFIAESEKTNYKELTSFLEKSSVLTINSNEVFLRSGGIINFVIKSNKVRFEVNVAAAKRSGLEISSKLLRLAVNVVEQDEKTSNSEQGKQKNS